MILVACKSDVHPPTRLAFASGRQRPPSAAVVEEARDGCGEPAAVVEPGVVPGTWLDDQLGAGEQSRELGGDQRNGVRVRLTGEYQHGRGQRGELAGISTSIGVESTARAANERGYELTIVTDAITDPDEGAHLNSLRAIFPRIAELATTDEVLTALDRVRPVELRAGPGG